VLSSLQSRVVMPPYFAVFNLTLLDVRHTKDELTDLFVVFVIVVVLGFNVMICQRYPPTTNFSAAKLAEKMTKEDERNVDSTVVSLQQRRLAMAKQAKKTIKPEQKKEAFTMRFVNASLVIEGDGDEDGADNAAYLELLE
jgi:hypothetical protein